MADPLSIIGTAGAIANIIDVLTKTITTVCDMRQAWKIADLSVFAFENQLNLLKFALFEIQKWTESRSSEQSHQLVMQVDCCVTCCRLLIGKIEGEVSQFQKTTAGDLDLGSKLSFLFKTKDMEQIQRMVDQQTHTLTLVKCLSALVEQTRILQQPKLVQAIQDMDRDTASLIVHRDSDSIITATSVSSSRWSVQFAFDRELFISKVYDKWIRKLATTRRANTHSTEDPAQRDHQQISKNGIAVMDPPNDHEQNIVALESVSMSKRTSPSRSYSGRWSSPPRRVHMTISLEIQLCRDIRNMKILDPQAKESPRRGWTSGRAFSYEVRAVILGSKSRERVFEEMRLSDGRRECYTVDQLRLFRPMILGTVLDSVRYLAKWLLDDEGIREDPIRTTLECILIPNKDEDLNLDSGFESSLVEKIRTMMKHPATERLMVDERLMFEENGEYFLKQVERFLQHNYFPTDSDAVNCATPLPYSVEAAFNFGSPTMLLTDPGNTEYSWTKGFEWTRGFDTAVIYVLDLSSPYDEALLNYELTVKLQMQKLRTFSFVVIVNNFKDFTKRLSEASLSGVEFSKYTGGNDTEKAAKYFASKIKDLSPGGIHLHVHFTGGVYEERNLEGIWVMVQEVIKIERYHLLGIM